MHVSTTEYKSDTATRISLVLPAWNEAEAIESAINEAVTALTRIADEFEIIVVDDGSSDDTAQIVQQAAQQMPQVRLVQHETNQGYGASLRTGFRSAKMDLVAFTDADCQFDLSELDRFVLLARDYDVVCGYRIDRKDTPLRCFYSRVYNHLVRCMIGTSVRDIDCALKMFRREVVEQLEITTDGFLVNSELLTQARVHGRSIVEVGVSHRPRTKGASTVSIRHIPTVLISLSRYWWNHVQFPGSYSQSESQGFDETSFLDKQYGWLQVALLLVATVFVFTNLGYPLIDRDETRYAEIPREMLETGNWVLPHLNFEPYYDKPPMLYWLCATSYLLFGISEWSARLVPAIAALLTLATTMFFASRWFNRKVGLFSGAVLMLSVGFAFVSRYLLIDGLFAFLVTLGLCTSLEAIRAKRIRMSWWLASAVITGLGILTKGPLAVVLWLPPIFAIAWISESYARIKVRHYVVYLGTSVAVAAPWFLAVARQDANFLTEFFVEHNLHRFAGGFHDRPIWYFIPVLLVAGHPWSFLSIPFTRFMLSDSNETRANRPPVLGFLVLWSCWSFLFFSLSKCKLPTYLLPSAPAFAMMIGYFLYHSFQQQSVSLAVRFQRYWCAKVATITTCIAGVGFVVYGLAMELEISTKMQVWALLWTALLVGSVMLINDNRHRQTAWLSSGIVAGLLCLMVMHEMVPAYSRSETILGQDSRLAEHVRASTSPIATVGHEFSEVPYYLASSHLRHWQDPRSPGLRHHLAGHSDCLLFWYRDCSPETLSDVLPEGARITQIANRGPAKILRIVHSVRPERLAREPVSKDF